MIFRIRRAVYEICNRGCACEFDVIFRVALGDEKGVWIILKNSILV